VAFAPIINGTYIVKLKAMGEVASGTDYACQVAEVVIEAEAGDVTEFQPLCVGTSFKAAGPTAWKMTMNYAQDYLTGGLALWLYNNDGKKFAGEINPYGQPAAATTPSFTVNGTVIAGPIGGGAKGEFALGEVELPLDSKPLLVVTPPTLTPVSQEGEIDVEAEAAAANGSKAKVAA
jgi:hypothetical protein